MINSISRSLSLWLYNQYIFVSCTAENEKREKIESQWDFIENQEEREYFNEKATRLSLINKRE